MINKDKLIEAMVRNFETNLFVFNGIRVNANINAAMEAALKAMIAELPDKVHVELPPLARRKFGRSFDDQRSAEFYQQLKGIFNE